MSMVVVVAIAVVICACLCLRMLWPTGLVPVTSTLDGERYLVRNDALKQMAADRLAEVSARLQTLVDFLSSSPQYSNDPRVRTLLDRWPRTRFRETEVGSDQAAYSRNKGETVALCLGRMSPTSLGDLNTTMYVAVHECAHVATPGYNGHDEDFWRTMRLLLKVAIQDVHIYQYVPYESSPTSHCGHTIAQSPYTCLTNGTCM